MSERQRAIAYSLEEGFCPSCGNWCDNVITEVGWCTSCYQENKPESRICMRCSKAFPTHANGNYCSACKVLNWLERNADALEDQMAQGKTFKEAKVYVLSQIRPKCVVCHSEIRGGRTNALFCGKTDECRKQQSLYFGLRSKGFDREWALRVLGKWERDGEIQSC